MVDFTEEDLSAEDVERLRRIYGPLSLAVRELIDATIRTEVDADVVDAARAEIEAATARLRTGRSTDHSASVQYRRRQMPWGNAVIGTRNPVAPPLVFEPADDGSMSPTSISARPTRGHQVTYTGESRR